MHKIGVTLSSYGTKVYQGRKCRKYSHEAASLLVDNGWELVHATQSYAYLAPPGGGDAKRVELLVEVPSDDELGDFFCALRARGAAWKGEAFGWPASYTPGHVTRSTSRTIDPFAPEGQPRERIETRDHHRTESAEIGKYPLWHRVCHWHSPLTDDELIAKYGKYAVYASANGKWHTLGQ